MICCLFYELAKNLMKNKRKNAWLINTENKSTEKRSKAGLDGRETTLPHLAEVSNPGRFEEYPGDKYESIKQSIPKI